MKEVSFAGRIVQQGKIRPVFTVLGAIMRPSCHASFLCASLLLSGCAAAPHSTPPPSNPAAIFYQPLSQTVPIGETATFTVTAYGTAPLSYQWSENGDEIPGATAASYTTPPVALGAGGSALIGSYQVAVSNAFGFVLSNAVTLTAGPRSPKPGDLRYLLEQQVDLPGLGNDGGGASDIGLGDESSIGNAVGTPLQMGAPCTWEFSYFSLPPPMTGLDMYYQTGFTNEQSYTSYLQSIAAPNVVVTSMDLQPACQEIGVSWVQTAQPGGFDQRQEAVPMGAGLQTQLQATAAADGAESRIVTAVTFDDASGEAVLLSYGWTGDTTTVYEAQTSVVAASEAGAAAATLASNGYFISAFGGNSTDGFVLVGMRAQGDTLPRPINAQSGTDSDPAYFTTVVSLFPGLLIEEQ